MKKLEDIPKKEVFKVPDGYFDNLPNIIQARVAEKESKPFRPVFSFALRYALPVVVLGVAGILWFNRGQDTATAESILASIQTEDLVAYLNDADLTTDELIEEVVLDAEDANEIEGEVYGLDLDEEDFEKILDEI
jgi:hypothetical protein